MLRITIRDENGEELYLHIRSKQRSGKGKGLEHKVTVINPLNEVLTQEVPEGTEMVVMFSKSKGEGQEVLRKEREKFITNSQKTT